MANVYVYSGAAGAGTGADWTNAYTTLAAACAAKAAGDDFWVAHDHAETQATAITITSPGTLTSPCRIVCVNRAGTVPLVSADLRTTATVTTTSGSRITQAGGRTHCHGITFSAGTGSGAALIVTPAFWTFVSCGFTLGTSSGSANTVVLDGGCVFESCTFTFSSADHGWSVGTSTAEAIVKGGSLAGTVPTTLISSSNAYTKLTVTGCDLSLLGSGKTIVNMGLTSPLSQFDFVNCKVGTSVTLSGGTMGVSSTRAPYARFVNCDSSNTNYRYSKQTVHGTITQETVIVRTGGATDGVTPFSRKMVSTANSRLYSPLESDWVQFWNDTLSSTTVTVPVITDNVTLKDTEAWVEVEEMGTSGFPQSVTQSDRAADILNAGTNQTTDATSTWTTTGLTTPVKQSLSVTFTPTGKGWVRARVMLAKASTTMYFDPDIITGAAQYMLPSGDGINYPASSSAAGLSPPATIVRGQLSY